MRLTAIQIQNIKSLRDVSIQNLGQLNSFVGQNNSGKSAIFQALKLLRRSSDNYLAPPQSMIHQMSSFGAWKIEVEFSVSDTAKRQIIPLDDMSRGENSLGKERIWKVYQPPFLTKLKYSITKGINSLQRDQWCLLEILSEKAEWLTLHEDNRVTTYEGNTSQTTVSGNSVNLYPYLTPNMSGEPDDPSLQEETTHQYANRLRDTFTFQVDPDPSNELLGATVPESNYLARRILSHIGEYFEGGFFFNPQRQSQPKQEVLEVQRLSSSGDNLPQIMTTLNLNNKSAFDRITRFVEAALPDIGILHTTLDKNETAIEFQSPNFYITDEPYILRNNPKLANSHVDYKFSLHNMGGGVEQLVLIATALNTTSDTPLFIEEPETHLHPSAQRYLLEKLNESGRQVFITTHSPVFVNSLYPDNRVYRIKKDRDTSQVIGVSDPLGFTQTLNEIGARNSDVLLADAVLFVEGDTDILVLTTLASKLRQPFASKGVAHVRMGGASNFHSAGVARSKTLTDISEGAPVPHLFLIDRDHRTSEEIAGLITRLDGKLHVLDRREIENYLLAFRPILEALKERDGINQELLQSQTSESIRDLILRKAEALKHTVLTKRIKNVLGGLEGGFLTRQSVTRLIDKNDLGNLTTDLLNEVTNHVNPKITEQRINEIISEQTRLLDEEWETNKLKVVPGKDVLEKVYEEFGVTFNALDTPRIASKMTEEEIPDEIKKLIGKIAALAKPSR